MRGRGFCPATWEFAKRSGRKPSRRTPTSEPLNTTFQKRVAMPDRKSLVSTLCLTSSLSPLVWVLVGPVWTSGFVIVSSRPDCLRRDLGVRQPTTRVSAATTTDAVLKVDALPSESEEQERAYALDEPRVSFVIPYSFRNAADRQLIAPRSLLSLYPLRC